MLLTKFQKHVQQWEIEEKTLASKTPSPDELVSQIAGSVTNLQESLELQQEGGSLLARTKRRVRRDISQDGALTILLANFRAQNDQISEIQSRLEDIDQNLQDIQQLLQNRPSPPDTSPLDDAISALNDRRNTPSSSSQRPQAASSIERLSERISESDLNTFLDNQQHFEARKTTTRTNYTVRELRDQYYTYQVRVGRGNTSNSNDYVLIDPDTNTSIDQLDGYDDIEVDDNTIIAKGSPRGLEQHKRDTVEIQQSQSAPPSKPPSKGSQKTQKIQKHIKQAKDKNTHAYWACGILELAKLAKEQAQQVSRLINDTLNELMQIPNQLKQGMALPATKQEEIRRATELLQQTKQGIDDAIEDYTEIGGNIVEIETQLTFQSDVESAHAVCDKKHQAYCQAHEAMARLWNDVRQELPSVEALVSLPSLPFDPLQKVEELESDYINAVGSIEGLTDKLDKMERELCEWIDNPRQGTPQSLQQSQQQRQKASKTIGNISLPIDPLANAVSTIFPTVIAQLTKAGYTEAAKALTKGDVEAFMAMEEAKATSAGKTADVLDQAADQAKNEARASRLRTLRDTAEVRHEQKTSPQRVREEMRARLGNKPAEDQTKLIKDEGRDLIEKVET